MVNATDIRGDPRISADTRGNPRQCPWLAAALFATGMPTAMSSVMSASMAAALAVAMLTAI